MNLKIFKTKKKFKKSEHQPNPDFYWKIIFFITAVLVFIALGFGIDLFLKVNKEDFSPTIEQPATEDDGQSQKISNERINKVLEYFADRENKSKNILNSASPIKDPSL